MIHAILPSMTPVFSLLHAVDSVYSFVITTVGQMHSLAKKVSQLFFDCVSAPEQQEENKVQPLSEKQVRDLSHKRETKQVRKIDRVVHLVENASDVYQKFIEEHFEPYFTGKITKENEDRNRLPLIEKFLNTEDGKKELLAGSAKQDIEEALLDMYILEAAKGLNRHKLQKEFALKGTRASMMLVQPGQYLKPQEQILFIQELKRALLIDFRGKRLPDENIEKRVFWTLRRLYEEAYVN